MMNKIYEKALECKEFADKRIKSCRHIYRTNNTEQTYVQGDIKGYENLLYELRTLIKDKYPLIERQLAEKMSIYDSNRFYYQGIIESIIESIISLEIQTQISENKPLCSIFNTRKFFISHSSSDRTIVNGFIKEILKIGCGFKDNDIFCTLDPTSIRTGDDFREKIVENMRGCDYILLFISENYNLSDVCKNEMGAAWALENKRTLPFVLPNTKFEQMGFLNVVKQGASLLVGSKLDEFYKEVCEFYNIEMDWFSFNKAKEDFIESVKKIAISDIHSKE
ncbi:MAG: toll/interleukin-1 receptor domain-containing protein [Bacteroidaceae bacterium]|nr:toll/interleukin-1 receptor domain-containing protein [Bacteroidaceae bacterium]